MNGQDVLKAVMRLRGMSSEVLANKLGYAHASGVSERLRNKQDVRADTLAKFLEAMDCEIIVRSKIGDKEKWIIDGSSESARSSGSSETVRSSNSSESAQTTSKE